MQNYIACIKCQTQLLIPIERKKEFARNHSFTCQCHMQYQYTYHNHKFQLVGAQFRFTGFNMWHNFKFNTTRFVKMEKRIKGENAPAREEYNFDGLILPERFNELKLFL